MAMKLLPFHNQFVSDFSPNNEHDNLMSFHIIQRPQISCAQFKLGKGIGAQLLDCFRRPRGLVLQPG